MLLQLIQKYLEERGVYNLKIKDLRQFIQERLQEGDRAPAASTLQKIIREKFNLRYGAIQTTTLKYFEGTYQEKRLWTSRLLA